MPPLRESCKRHLSYAKNAISGGGDNDGIVTMRPEDIRRVSIASLSKTIALPNANATSKLVFRHKTRFLIFALATFCLTCNFQVFYLRFTRVKTFQVSCQTVWRSISQVRALRSSWQFALLIFTVICMYKDDLDAADEAAIPKNTSEPIGRRHERLQAGAPSATYKQRPQPPTVYRRSSTSLLRRTTIVSAGSTKIKATSAQHRFFVVRILFSAVAVGTLLSTVAIGYLKARIGCRQV